VEGQLEAMSILVCGEASEAGTAKLCRREEATKDRFAGELKASLHSPDFVARTCFECGSPISDL